MAEEPTWDFVQTVSQRLPDVKIYQYLEPSEDAAQAHLQEKFASVFVDRFYFVQNREISPLRQSARNLIAQVQEASSALVLEGNRLFAKILGQHQPVLVGGPRGGPSAGGTPPASGGEVSDDAGSRYVESGLSKSQIAIREIENAVSTLEGKREWQEVLDWVTREQSVRFGGKISEARNNNAGLNIEGDLNIENLVIGGTHHGQSGGRRGYDNETAKHKNNRFRALPRAVAQAIQTLAAAFVIYAGVIGTAIAPAGLPPNTNLGPWESAVVTAESELNVRQSASIEADKIGAIHKGQIVEAEYDVNADFVLVRFGDENGKTHFGFVAREYLQYLP